MSNSTEYFNTLDQVDNNRRTLLHYTSTCNLISKAVIKYLVSKNEARLLAKTTKGSTPLHLACDHMLLLKNLCLFVDREGAVLKVKNNKGQTPLYVACCEKIILDVINFLIDSCPSALEMVDIDGYVLLHGACCSPNLSLELVELLITRNKMTLAAKATKGGNGKTPLHLAAAGTGQCDLVGLLAQKNPAILVEPDSDGLTPLHAACALSNLDTVKILLKMKLDTLKCKSHQHITPFLEACLAENMPVVVHIAESFPAILEVKCTENGWYPLHHVCTAGKKEALKYLLEKYPNAAKEVDLKGRTPLALFARFDECDTSTLHKLVASHYDSMKIVDLQGNPPLSHEQKDALIMFFLENR